MNNYVRNIVAQAKNASYKMLSCDTALKDVLIQRMAQALSDQKEVILRANARDLKNARTRKMQESLIDRLRLTESRIEQMSISLKEIANLKDPIGNVIAGWRRPNGLQIEKVRVPIGVILIIYEARPNVTSDCIGLCLKSSNIAILRGGSDALHSNRAIVSVLQEAVQQILSDFQPFYFVDTTDRALVGELLKQDKYIDLVIPRGGETLIRKVVTESSIPVIKHYKGVCHIYVDRDADIKKALTICSNAKVQRPSVCNAVETILVHKKIAAVFLPKLKKLFDEFKVVIKGDKATKEIIPSVKLAREEDWYTEYLNLTVSIRVVDDVYMAVEHINRYGSGHTDSILSENIEAITIFTRHVDSACCFVNISTRFSDGFQFGLGAEIGISTDKLHARGPMGLEELTTYKFVVVGQGQIRE